MSNLLKKSYEISLWSDEYIEPIDEVSDGKLVEIKLATIGSNKMDSPIRAFAPKLTRQINGTKTLTFQIYNRYYDEDEEEFKLNPFLSLLTNERKVKLYYDNKWYDFIIKDSQEQSENNIFTYTCKDLYINELSKNGYSLTFDTTLENNLGTITELGSKIVEGTDWEIDIENSDLIQQKEKETLYECTLGREIIATCLWDFEEHKKGDLISIAAGEKIYVFYSSYINKENPLQFLYCPKDTKVDKNGIIVNSANWSTNFSTAILLNKKIKSDIFGEKLISKQDSKYVSEIDKYCNIYKKEEIEYYSFTETEYSTVTEIKNLLVNSNNFISSNSWSTPVDSETKISISNYTKDDKVYKTLNINFGDGGSVVNDGLYDNRSVLNGFKKGDTYIFAILTNENDNISGASITGNSYSNPNDENIYFTFEEYKESIPEVLNGYKIFEAPYKVDKAISTNELLKMDIKFYVEGTGAVELIDAKLFKKITDSNGDIIVPDLQKELNSIIKIKYYFFPRTLVDNISPQQIFSIDDIQFTEICYEDELLDKGYEIVFSSNFEKKRTISASKSNRFNLIQELCEIFECWADFKIEHDELGKIINKKIAFKKFIGQENQVGFRYGINLKSIQRKINSDQIVTKTIVEPNTNQYADNGLGSCTIQTSKLNPSGENFIFNFDYYIRQKLLDEDELNKDLYEELYPRLKELNLAAAPYIDEVALISNTLTGLESRQIAYDTIILESQELYNEAIDEIRRISGPEVDPATITKSDNKYINDWIIKRDEATSSIDRYKDISSNNKILLEDSKSEQLRLTEELNKITSEKEELLEVFYKKYFRFIQEGTWTSNDYINSEDYYLDGQMVAYTSAFPKLTYTINVLEISQIEGFERYTFEIGDKTYMEDTEFFGWQKNGRPYQEEIVVSEVVSNLDEPSQNTIKVQNYKTQFEDLFQRITAATQSLQYHEGEYTRAAQAINSDGTINSSLLQNSLKNNNLILQNAKNESVFWDETGITISSFVDSNKIVRLTSGGIVLSSDGGRNWTTGITGEGINASTITTGRLDTNLIRIFNSNQKTFEWNSRGLHAYEINENEIPNYDKFVRFDQYGLYGYELKEENDESEPVFEPQNIDDVVNNAFFSLTWKGLTINLPKPTSEIEQKEVIIKVGDNFKVLADGSIEAKNGNFSGTIKGTLATYPEDSDTAAGYIGFAKGMRIDSDGKEVITEGIAFSFEENAVTDGGPYFIVTEGGARMSFGTLGSDKSYHLYVGETGFGIQTNIGTDKFSGSLENYIKKIIEKNPPSPDSDSVKNIINESYIKDFINETYIKGIINSSYINSSISSTTINNAISSTTIKNIIDADYIQGIINSSYIQDIIGNTLGVETEQELIDLIIAEASSGGNTVTDEHIISVMADTLGVKNETELNSKINSLSGDKIHTLLQQENSLITQDVVKIINNTLGVDTSSELESKINKTIQLKLLDANTELTAENIVNEVLGIGSSDELKSKIESVSGEFIAGVLGSSTIAGGVENTAISAITNELEDSAHPQRPLTQKVWQVVEQVLDHYNLI